MLGNFTMIPYILLILYTICLSEGFRQLDQLKLEEGRRQYDVVVRNKNMPKYGQCWTSTMLALQTTCVDVSDEMQTRLALAYLNCFLMSQGRQTYPCDDNDSLQVCTQDLSESDRSSLTTFFTHTHNICYFLKSQVWHENAENTINLLSTKSDEVASKLEKSSYLQHEIILQQNKSLVNQKIMLSQAEKLSSVINESSNSIHNLFTEYQRTTHEQRMLINEIFDRISRIQTTFLGEYVSLYSIFMYTFGTIICYILTSTSRTSGARLPLFCIVALNFFIEWQIATWLSRKEENLTRKEEADHNDTIYRNQWICRQISSVCGCIVILVCAWRYTDINTINNQYLIDIKKELKRVLEEGQRKTVVYSMDSHNGIVTELNGSDVNSIRHEKWLTSRDQQDDLGYHSNTHIDTINRRECTEPLPNKSVVNFDIDTDSESSFSTARNGIDLGTETPQLPRSFSGSRPKQKDTERIEVFYGLRESIQNWATTGHFVKEICPKDSLLNVNHTNDEGHLKKTPSAKEPVVVRRYNLRQRKQKM